MRAKVAWAFRAVAMLAALLATVQPVLGSFAFFRQTGVDLDQVHLVIGGVLYNLSIVLIALAVFTGFRRRWMVLGLCVLQYGLLHVQLLLGLNANDDAGLLAFHIPVGVSIFLVSYVTAALGFGARVDPERA